MDEIALIVYGDGGELGKFEVFAKSLCVDLKKKYKKITKKYINRDVEFFKLILSINSNTKISEMHIFSHAIGAGIFLGYKDTAIAINRERVWRIASQSRRKITYHEVVKTEVGAIQTDDLIINPIVNKKSELREKFSSDAFIKIWGCNSGADGWVYSDNGVVHPSDISEPYYWRAFNESNKPKPSIAQAFATFFNVKVFGAKSGANIEVKYKNKWMSTGRYKNNIGHWPSGKLPHRLVPEKGIYHEFKP